MMRTESKIIDRQPPAAVELIAANIPAEMRELPQWVVWRWTWNDKKQKWDKPPLCVATGRHANSTDRKTWSTFETATLAVTSPGSSLDGVGFVFTKDDPFVGLDMDHCRDAETGDIQTWTAEQRKCKYWTAEAPEPTDIIKRLGSYAEVSPSGTGLHVIVRGKLAKAVKHGSFEAYDWGRYFCMTGNRLEGAPTTISKKPEALAVIVDEFCDTPEPQPTVYVADDVAANDETIIEKARGVSNGCKFSNLYDRGDWKAEGCPSESEGDLALCSLLAFWAGPRPHVIDRMFRGSALMREKWNRDDYRARTIATALEGRTDFYDGNGSAQSQQGSRLTSVVEAERELENIGSLPGKDVFTPRIINALAVLYHDDRAKYALHKMSLPKDVSKRELDAAVKQAVGKLRSQTTAGDDPLAALGIDVLGEQGDQSIVLWLPRSKKRWTIKSPARWPLEEILQAVGQSGADMLWSDSNTPPPAGKFTPAQLRRAVALAASASPRLSEKSLVGQGVYKHEDRLLIVRGAEAMLYDGQKMDAVGHPRVGRRIIDFDASKAWGPPLAELAKSVESMSADKARETIDDLTALIEKWNWSHLFDPELVAALVAATFVQSVWTWRPLVSIAGETDSGKSTFFSELLQPVFGEWTIAADRSTEAGLRQAISHDSCPVLLDEFDKYRHRNQVLELFRTASRGGRVLRGTKDQVGRSYGVRHIPWFAAIESGDLWGADRNRTIRLELRVPDNRGSLVLPGSSELELLGHRVLAAAVWAAPSAVALADRIKSTRIEGVHGRIVESFSVPAALYVVFRNGLDTAEDQAAEQLRDFIKGRQSLARQGEPDEVVLLREIVSANIRVPLTSGGEMHSSTEYHEYSVGQLLQADEFQNQEDIEAKGLKLVSVRNSKQKRLFISHDAVATHLLRGTRWSDLQIDQILIRLPGAQRQQQRCGGQRPWGISLPWPDCLDGIGPQDSEQDTVEPTNHERKSPF